MWDEMRDLDETLSGLKRAEWQHGIARLCNQNGSFEKLDDRHFAALIRNSDTLLVTFETVQGIRALNDNAQPLGWETVKALRWSHLALVCDGDTWFREDAVYAYFDKLVDDNFFDAFETVVFYGAGPCGYAAAAFSVVAPGASVVLVQPQATLSPEYAGWDDRFVDERRLDFTSRYGFAPAMIEAAREAFVIYDPYVSLDAMHAAMFNARHITHLPTRHFGATIQTHLMEMQLIYRILGLAGAGKLSRGRFARMMRVRRNYPPYLRNLLSKTERTEHPLLTKMLCQNVTARMKAPKFARRLAELSNQEVS